MINPDDQVLDYFVYLSKTHQARADVEKFETGYKVWLLQSRR